MRWYRAALCRLGLHAAPYLDVGMYFMAERCSACHGARNWMQGRLVDIEKKYLEEHDQHARAGVNREVWRRLLDEEMGDQFDWLN